jgi:hypothetical protein
MCEIQGDFAYQDWLRESSSIKNYEQTMTVL